MPSFQKSAVNTANSYLRNEIELNGYAKVDAELNSYSQGDIELESYASTYTELNSYLSDVELQSYINIEDLAIQIGRVQSTPDGKIIITADGRKIRVYN
jgi:hypothetical protein